MIPVNPKTKEVHFKILNNIYPSHELLGQRLNIAHSNCFFCDLYTETTDHLTFCLFFKLCAHSLTVGGLTGQVRV